MQTKVVIGVDIAKTVFEIAVSPEPGSIIQRERLKRACFLAFFVNRPPALVAMEACGSAHAWARQIQALDHEVRLLPPPYVRPYIRRNKTDRTDAAGIVEAVRNADLKPVPIKSLEQQIVGSLHRFRSGWMAERTARLNTLRGLLRELGYAIPVGAHQVVPHVRLIIADDEGDFPHALRSVFDAACVEMAQIEERIHEVERELETLAKHTPMAARLRSVPGVGLLTATALLAFVGDIRRFPSAREFASYLGLTPREFSSGARRRLGRISKRGDSYLRMLLIHGARAVLTAAKRVEQPDRLRAWALALEKRVKHNVATVALANKLARIIWAVWKNDSDYRSQPTLSA